MGQVFNRRSELDLRRTLRNARPPAEVLLWKRLQRKQVAAAKFRRQQGVENYVVDFYCPEVRLAIELDGESHNGQEAVENDAVRQQLIESYGVVFLRFTNREVYRNIESVVDTIESKIEVLRQENHLRATIIQGAA